MFVEPTPAADLSRDVVWRWKRERATWSQDGSDRLELVFFFSTEWHNDTRWSHRNLSRVSLSVRAARRGRRHLYRTASRAGQLHAKPGVGVALPCTSW